jgi:ferredoxin
MDKETEANTVRAMMWLHGHTTFRTFDENKDWNISTPIDQKTGQKRKPETLQQCCKVALQHCYFETWKIRHFQRANAEKQFKLVLNEIKMKVKKIN